MVKIFKFIIFRITESALFSNLVLLLLQFLSVMILESMGMRKKRKQNILRSFSSNIKKIIDKKEHSTTKFQQKKRKKKKETPKYSRLKRLYIF